MSYISHYKILYKYVYSIYTLYICIFTHRHFKTDLYLKHMMVWLWKSPIPLKGKDKHDTQTLRLTFLFVAFLSFIKWISCVCCHSKMTSFLSAWGHFQAGWYVGLLRKIFPRQVLETAQEVDFSSCLAIYYNKQINHYSHFSPGATQQDYLMLFFLLYIIRIVEYKQCT